MYKSHKTTSKRKSDKIDNKVSDKRVKVSSNSLKELFNKQKNSSKKVKLKTSDIICLLSDDDDESFKEIEKKDEDLDIYNKEETSAYSDINYNNLKKENSNLQSNGDFQNVTQFENLNESDTYNTEAVFSNASYVKNFKLIILMVTNNPLYDNLFDAEDRKIVDDFLNKLKTDEQTLYVRLFVRKHQWLRVNQINYPSLPTYLSILPKLVQKEFLSNELHKAEMVEILEKLPSPDLKSLCKSLQLDHSKKRVELISEILKHSNKKNISSFFKKSQESNNQSTFIKERACKLLGVCYKLSHTPHNLLTRIVTLAYLHASVSDNDNCGQQLIYQMMLSSNQSSTFPEYTINLISSIYLHRKDLQLYIHLLQEEGEVYRLVEKKDWTRVLEVYSRVENMYGSCMLDSQELRHYSKLPSFLRTFTPPACFVRITEKAYHVYQTLKLHEDAVRLQLWLLRQPHFHHGHRGRWYDRVTLNLSFHLKRHQEAFDLIMDAMKDSYVRTGYRLDLFLRATKILTMKCMKDTEVREERVKVLEEDPMKHLKVAQAVTIHGQLIPKLNPAGNTYWIVPTDEKNIRQADDDDDDGECCEDKDVKDGGSDEKWNDDKYNKTYSRDDNEDDKIGDEKDSKSSEGVDEKTDGGNMAEKKENEINKIKIESVFENKMETNYLKMNLKLGFREKKMGVGVGRVEEVALSHYAQQGYTEGIHGEGMTLTTIFFLFSWNIIFSANTTDTFINPFQSHPLDLRTDDFYLKRKKEFDILFAELKNADSKRLSSMAADAWDQHHMTTSIWADWSLLRDRDYVQSLVSSVGGELLSVLVEKFAKEMRYVVGGVPDLLVWNPLLHKAMWVEVKGPGDKLSSKQLVWIDFLIRNGADVQVCHVVAKNPKRITTN